jgi:hypothetical protein
VVAVSFYIFIMHKTKREENDREKERKKNRDIQAFLNLFSRYHFFNFFVTFE